MARTPTVPRRPFTVAEFHRMREVDLFGADERIELMHGDLHSMAAPGAVHGKVVDSLVRKLEPQIGPASNAVVGRRLSLPPDCEPMPDILVVRRTLAEGECALAEDVLLLIEVSDTTLAYDREVKIPVYAKHAIPEVWLVNLAGKTMIKFRQPRDRSYGVMLERTRLDVITPEKLPRASVSVGEIFA